MIVRRDEMPVEKRDNMRGGEGTIQITHFDSAEKMKNSRLAAEIIIPVGGSIGEHAHNEETEYYFIQEGQAVVVDDGVEKSVAAGEVVITGNGAQHSIRNAGDVPVKMIAVIVTY